MTRLKKTALLTMVISSLTLTGCLSGGGGGSSSNDQADNRVRLQDQRVEEGFFNVNEAGLPFDALPEYSDSSRWTGVLNGAGYRIEVPANWNGMLVMYTHGFRINNIDQLTVDTPPMRRYLLEEGYAWAASSYSANFYDVRAGLEDTNALALAFTDIAAENGRTLDTPDKYYITGVSMGGHIAAAAVERETLATANNVVNYSGSAPMCGVVGDTELFNFFAGYTIALATLSGNPIDEFPLTQEEAATIVANARTVLWNDYTTNKFPSGLTQQGLAFYQTLKNLSGGERPMYPISFGLFQDLLQGFAGSDGTVDGILLDNVVDTNAITYRFESELGEPLTTDEINFNSMIVKATATEGANDLRDDGLRWIPKVNGEFDVPVVTAHTIGDLFVPILMEQEYARRAAENGSDDLLVQRAIRAPGHCDFTEAEFTATLAAMLDWEQGGPKPGGDDWLTPATVAAEDFGCTYTIDGPVAEGNYPRAGLPSCTPD
ncbi:hypothetical protein SAMN05216586_11118 [Halopseudomonas aestusnigri]|uniref:Alpha/beta hydrolase n=2 Tax=Halopseudomonas aestusnigri TaxID=857252 RepID=A0AAQ1JQX7_9GAMM|nr:hypothetical protein B7O88_14195 [Halopseudomonas aestusnigri]SEG59772.1 hypothetical protein SAMN05216586_11118 [Halopseudomonas aestusnigri]